MPLPILCLTVVIVAGCAVWDWRTGEIPNAFTLPVLLLGPLSFFLIGGSGRGLSSLLGLVACGLPPYFFFRIGAMGGGDVKLFAAVGALVGPVLGAEILMASVLAGCVQALVIVWRRQQIGRVARTSWQILKNTFLPAGRRTPIAEDELIALRLGPAILVGTLLVLVRA